MMLWVPLAWARDIELKVHDLHGEVTGPVQVRILGPGVEIAAEPRDDGADPDEVAGDHMYTARIEGLTLEDGQVDVTSGDRKWAGGFRFDAQSDPVLLVGLETGGLAATSTREMVFAPPEPAPQAQAEKAEAPRPRERTVPDGLWAGWVIAAVATAGLGGIAWTAARRPPRVPPVAPARATTATRGPLEPAPGDLHVGPGTPGIGPGRWSPEEIAFAALAARAARVVVTDPARVDASGDAFAALSRALEGIADLRWIV